MKASWRCSFVEEGEVAREMAWVSWGPRVDAITTTAPTTTTTALLMDSIEYCGWWNLEGNSRVFLFQFPLRLAEIELGSVCPSPTYTYINFKPKHNIHLQDWHERHTNQL